MSLVVANAPKLPSQTLPSSHTASPPLQTKGKKGWQKEKCVKEGEASRMGSKRGGGVVKGLMKSRKNTEGADDDSSEDR